MVLPPVELLPSQIWPLRLKEKHQAPGGHETSHEGHIECNDHKALLAGDGPPDEFYSVLKAQNLRKRSAGNCGRRYDIRLKISSRVYFAGTRGIVRHDGRPQGLQMLASCGKYHSGQD